MTIARGKAASIHQQLLPSPTSTVQRSPLHHATATAYFEVDQGANGEHTFVNPAHVQRHQPGPQLLAESESERIQRAILDGREDGLVITRSERNGYVASTANASLLSSEMKKAIKSSVYVDTLAAHFRHQINPLLISYNSGYEEDLMIEQDAKRDFKNLAPLSRPKGYQMKEYKSVYESGATTSCHANFPGYQISEYKSIYDV